MDTYAVQTYIVENGKHIKGTLTLHADRYVFNDREQHVNWENVSCITGITKIKHHIVTANKPYVVLQEGNSRGPAFVLERKQVDQLMAMVSERKELARQKRLAAESKGQQKEEAAQNLQENVEKKQQHGDEPKHQRENRISQESQESQEKVEAYQNEDAQKKREEDTRRQKEEEERLDSEPQEIKKAERKIRIEEEVQRAKDCATQIDIDKGKDMTTKKAWSVVAENPYRILGISVKASTEEANAVLDKIKKLDRLNAVSSYKTEYRLNGAGKPERNVSIVQNALTMTREMKYKWFWFADVQAPLAWQDDSYRREWMGELVIDGMESGSYDLFLANYLYALIFDPCFWKPALWRPVFVYYVFICIPGNRDCLKSRFNEREIRELHFPQMERSFKEEIFKPLIDLCDTEDVQQIVRLYQMVKEFTHHELDEVKKRVAGKLTGWFTVREKEVCKLVNDADEDRVITPAEAKEIKEMADRYGREVDNVLTYVLSAVESESVRYDMIKESYRHATWQVMFGLNKARYKEDAIRYANKCYPYCSDEDKRKIRNTFGFTAIKGAEQDVTDMEWDIMGDNYYEGKNGYEQDYEEAVMWYTMAAEAGNKYAQNSLGICYKNGYGTYQSDYAAAQWFEKAYQNGSADGAFQLANCYAMGEGRSEDKQKAVELYLEAAEMGHPSAATVGKKLLDLMLAEQKLHRLTQHEHYDLGYQLPIGELIIVEVTLNYSANVYLMENEDYQHYKVMENYHYYGGRATKSPYRIKIPHAGFWHLIIDNGDEDMTGIITHVRTRTMSV